MKQDQPSQQPPKPDAVDKLLSQIEIELRPHIGIMRGPDGITREVEHPQWIVIATIGEWFHKQIGFLAQGKGAILAAVPEMYMIPEADRPAVMDAVSKAAGWDVGLTMPPSVIELDGE